MNRTLPLTMRQERNFWAKVLIGDGCWEWTGARQKGYGKFGASWFAHRLSYLLLVGPIPQGLQLDHLCRNPGCVAPNHLEPVTGQINTLRGQTITAANAGKIVCKRQHPLIGEGASVYVYRGLRTCRICRRERDYARARARGAWIRKRRVAA
jgi:HNH endonuclease